MMSWLRSWFSSAPRAARRPAGSALRVEPLEGRVVPAGVLAFGTGAGVPGRVALFHDQNNDGVPDGSAYATLAVFGSFTGGVRVAVGDFVGDSHLELAVASGPGAAARVILFPLGAGDAPTGTFERFFPFGSAFTNGLSVARSHTAGATHDSLVVAADAGAQSFVQVYSDDTAIGGATAGDGLLANSRVDSFLAFGPVFSGGVRLAAGRDLTGGSVSDSVVLATGPGGLARVRVVKDANNDFRLSDNLSAAETFYPTGGWTGGLFVAIGDVGSPSANAELIVSRDAGAPPRVYIFSDANDNGLYGDDGGSASTFLPFDADFRGGVRVAYSRLSSPSNPQEGEVVVAPGSGTPWRVRVFKTGTSSGEIQPTDDPLAVFFPFAMSSTAGYFVAYGGNGL